MVFNATSNNISGISWRSVLLVEETEVPRDNHQPVGSHWQTLSYNVVHLTLIEIQTHNWTSWVINKKETWIVASLWADFYLLSDRKYFLVGFFVKIFLK